MSLYLFQLTAARRRLDVIPQGAVLIVDVSTHSRPKAAGKNSYKRSSQPSVSTHSRPKAAGRWKPCPMRPRKPFQLTAARRRLAMITPLRCPHCPFQLTAARRRLVWPPNSFCLAMSVSTHSRPKAAGPASCPWHYSNPCFNSQPPEGGWLHRSLPQQRQGRFNSQPPEGGWPLFHMLVIPLRCFNSQPPEGGWAGEALLKWASTRVSTHSRPKAAGFNSVASFSKSSFQLTAARRRLVKVFIATE